jgi:hypothetical protein
MLYVLLIVLFARLAVAFFLGFYCGLLVVALLSAFLWPLLGFKI